MGLRRTALTVLLLVIVAAALPTSAEGATPATSPTRLKVQLKWYHQAQFAGWYAAQDLGYFADQNLVVGTEPGSPNTNPVDALKSGDADVAEASMAQAVAASTNGRRFVNIAQIFQVSDSELICNASFTRPSASELDGATVAEHVAAPVPLTVSRIPLFLTAMLPGSPFFRTDPFKLAVVALPTNSVSPANTSALVSNAQPSAVTPQPVGAPSGCRLCQVAAWSLWLNSLAGRPTPAW